MCMATCYSSDALCSDILERRVHTCDKRQVIYDPTQIYKCLSVMLNTTGAFRRRVPYGCLPSLIVYD